MYQPANRFETSSAAEVYNHAKDQAVEMTHRAQELVEEHPGTSALVAFGVGLAVGLAVVACLPPQRRSMSSGHLSDWLSLKDLSRLIPEQLTRNW